MCCVHDDDLSSFDMGLIQSYKLEKQLKKSDLSEDVSYREWMLQQEINDFRWMIDRMMQRTCTVDTGMMMRKVGDDRACQRHEAEVQSLDCLGHSV